MNLFAMTLIPIIEIKCVCFSFVRTHADQSDTIKSCSIDRDEKENEREKKQ